MPDKPINKAIYDIICECLDLSFLREDLVNDGHTAEEADAALAGLRRFGHDRPLEQREVLLRKRCVELQEAQTGQKRALKQHAAVLRRRNEKIKGLEAGIAMAQDLGNRALDELAVAVAQVERLKKADREQYPDPVSANSPKRCQTWRGEELGRCRNRADEVQAFCSECWYAQEQKAQVRRTELEQLKQENEDLRDERDELIINHEQHCQYRRELQRQRKGV